MKAFRILAVVLVVLLAVAVALPFLVPLRGYLPTLEKLATQRLGEPVTIGDLRVRLLPIPLATLEDIRIGGGEVRIGSVRLHPDLLSLTAPVKVLRRVEVEGVVLDRALLDRLAHWSRLQSGPQTVLVRRLEVSNARLALAGWQWGPLRLAADLDTHGLRRLEAGEANHSLEVVLTPHRGQYDLQLTAHHWTLPVKPALRFDELNGKGTLDATGLVLTQLEGKLYGGELRANMAASWKDGVRMQGEARVANVEIAPVVRMLSPTTGLSGLLFGSGHFTLGAQDVAHVWESLRASFRFEVRKGVLSGVDLAGAVRSLAREGTRGGQTSFNEFTGMVHVAGRQLSLRELRIASGLLQAKGEVDVLPNRKLAGRVRVEMKGTASLVSVPLEITGTVSDPLLLPSRAALAGAVAGTGLLGPGIGTTVGIKAGEALERLLH